MPTTLKQEGGRLGIHVSLLVAAAEVSLRHLRETIIKFENSSRKSRRTTVGPNLLKMEQLQYIQ